jgi:hypothetical protein
VSGNNLSLNINKTMEMIVDFRKQQREHHPIHITETEMAHPHRQYGKERATATVPLQPQEAEEIWLVT